MAVVTPAIFQIAGFKDSGKTTLLEKVIGGLAESGYQTATIKHHGHGGKPGLIEGKDSDKHVKAGAIASLIEGGGRVLLQAEKPEWNLEEQIALLTVLRPQVILIEGHKHAVYPKAVLLRNEADLHLLKELKEIKVILCREPQVFRLVDQQTEIPAFLDIEKGRDWIIEFIKKEIE